MLDYLIKGDIGVKDGRFTAIREVKGAAKETTYASGKFVSRGFVD